MPSCRIVLTMLKKKKKPLRTCKPEGMRLHIIRLRPPQQLSRPSTLECDFSRLRLQQPAARRAQASQADAAACSDEFARLRSEMQEIMRIQATSMDQLRRDNAELQNRLAEAEAESPTRRHEQDLPHGLNAHPIFTPPGQAGPAEEEPRHKDDKKEKKSKKSKKHKKDDSSDSSSSIDNKMLFKMLKKVMKSRKKIRMMMKRRAHQVSPKLRRLKRLYSPSSHSQSSIGIGELGCVRLS